MKWNDEKHNYLVDLIKNHGTKWKHIAELMTNRFGESFSYDQVRARWRTNKDKIEPIEYKETVEIKQDGSQFSDRLISLTEEEMKDSNAVLVAHGYNPDEWEIVNAKSSMWHHLNKKMANPKTLYASKITVRPKTNGFNFDKLLDSIKQVPQVNIKPIHTRENTYLNIPLADMHFGIATYEDYKETQSKIINLIQKGHEEILFIIGNDLLHHDSHQNKTVSGREIEHADMTQAWGESKLFYYPLLEYALLNANKVKVTYVKGNHSETFEWCFIQMLKTRFSQIEFDDEYKERKVTMLGLNYIGATHGDKKRMQNLSENFAVEFPAEWSIASTRTVFTGHLHHERVIDKGGLILRQLPSGVKADQYHQDMGYTTAHKRFQVHEYSYDAERCIHYV